MRTRVGAEIIDQDRRHLLTTAAMGIAAAGALSLFPAHSTPAGTSDAIRPLERGRIPPAFNKEKTHAARQDRSQQHRVAEAAANRQ